MELVYAMKTEVRMYTVKSKHLLCISIQLNINYLLRNPYVGNYFTIGIGDVFWCIIIFEFISNWTVDFKYRNHMQLPTGNTFLSFKHLYVNIFDCKCIPLQTNIN